MFLYPFLEQNLCYISSLFTARVCYYYYFHPRLLDTAVQIARLPADKFSALQVALSHWSSHK